MIGELGPPVHKGSARARTVRRASSTTDQTRVGDMLRAAIVGAIVVAVALLAAPPSARSNGALSLPHAEAKLGCASCHGLANGVSPAAACTTCHGATAHVSTRPAHRALAASGRLACTTCHPAHGDAQGITFSGDGSFTQWNGDQSVRGALASPVPLRATVPLVSVRSCAGCHDVASPRDPLAACLSGPNATFVTCFDEHRRVDEKGAASGTAVCARQHGPSRFVAWDAVRSIAAHPLSVPSAAPASAIGLVALASAIAIASLFVLAKRRRRLARIARSAPSELPGAIVPARRTRLPRIDTSTCLGCYACVDACPFDVLEIKRYVAVVAKPAECCGVILCAQACPNESLRIDEGEVRDGAPRLDAHLESIDAPGVFLAGDLTGLPLIKNAIHQGARVVDRIAIARPSKRRSLREGASCDADVIVVGAGPAGLSAMLRAKERGLRAVCLEQGALAASIRQFPRNKVVFDPPLDLPLEGSLWLRETTKEELVAQWSRIVRTHGLDVREDHRVTAIARESSDLVVTANGPRGIVSLRAPHLLLAIGRRGTPRTLDPEVTAGAGDKLSYALADARTFAGAHVLIVGLGDAAMEAAIAIARQPDAVVTVSYRGGDFTRGKGRNVAELRELVARNRVRIVFESHVSHADPRTVTLRVGDRLERIPNDAILVLIGGAPSWDLVRAAGVRLEKSLPPEGIVPIQNLLRSRTSEAP